MLSGAGWPTNPDWQVDRAVKMLPASESRGGKRRARSCNSTLKEITDHLGFHYAAITRAI